jgi:hypothetical protein
MPQSGFRGRCIGPVPRVCTGASEVCGAYAAGNARCRVPLTARRAKKQIRLAACGVLDRRLSNHLPEQSVRQTRPGSVLPKTSDSEAALPAHLSMAPHRAQGKAVLMSSRSPAACRVPRERDQRQHALDRIGEHPKAYVVDVSAVPLLDSTGRGPDRGLHTQGPPPGRSRVCRA